MRRRHRGCVASPKAVKRGKGGDRCVLPLATSAASTLPSVGYLHCSITLLQLLVKLTSSAASTLPIKCWLLTLFNYFASIACETQYLTIKCWLLYIACENRYCVSDKAHCHSQLALQAPFLSLTYGYLQCSITVRYKIVR